ncbi:hypothetical protein I4U23_015783 [Adineta vaga]|nr:hypothetical protein I4U23_015783 [Adineta vaga]
MELDTINVVLPRLMSLPCLYSLTIETESDLKDFGQIYRSIFNLSKLKYFKLKAMDGIEHDIDISLPIATNQQLTSIQRLTLDHPCRFNQLHNILSYTSQISHLKIFSANDIRINVNNISSIRLPNLIHLSIEAYIIWNLIRLKC